MVSMFLRNGWQRAVVIAEMGGLCAYAVVGIQESLKEANITVR